MVCARLTNFTAKVMAIAFSCGAVACGSNMSSNSSACSGSRIFPINAVDDDSREALPSPIIAFEPNGLTYPTPDPNGVYAFGGEGDTSGTLSLPLPCGRWGVHVFANGYRCQSINSGNTGSLDVGLTPLSPNDQIPVIVSGVWSNAAPNPGSPETLTVVTTAPSTAAEDQVDAVVVAVTQSPSYHVMTLTPVASGKSSDGVTQTWTGQVLLPGTSGSYIYTIVASTPDCRASKILRLPLNTSG